MAVDCSSKSRKSSFRRCASFRSRSTSFSSRSASSSSLPTSSFCFTRSVASSADRSKMTIRRSKISE